ncbi:MAG: ACP S-malonyltransferase [Gemmatimonadetes bacterium]|nr:ACP S-malonyltransferase [Gemmatimonadota bacterium]
MKQGLLFPGQGSQHVGMGRGLAERFPVARETFEEADDTLGLSLSGIAWEGPAEALTATENAQPALYVHSLATYRVVRERLGPVAAAAGHSLGELSAHGAAGTWSFADGLRAVRLRGELMAQAGDSAPGTMAAVLGLAESAIAELCEGAAAAGMTVVPANLNAPGQVVVSGELRAIEWISSEAKKMGAKRVVPLVVSAAFHSPLMGPAAEVFREALECTTFHRPAFPVVSNVTAEPAEEPGRIRELLVRQLTAPVRWIECVGRMRALGVERFAELGPGRVLAGLNRRNAKGVPTVSLGTPESIDQMESAK